MFSNNHHNDGHVAVLVPAAIGIQEKLIESSPQKFYRPAYVGVRGWVGIELNRVSDEELSLHIQEGWRLIAPKKLQNAFDGVVEEESTRPLTKKRYLIRSKSKG